MERLPRIGDRIVEKQKNSTVKTVEEVACGHYIMARGFNLRRISWGSLHRYRLADGGRS